MPARKISCVLIVLGALIAGCGQGGGGSPASPKIQLSTSALTFSAVAGGPSPGYQEVTVANSGGGDLSIPTTSTDYAGAGGWLAIVVAGSAAPYTIIVQASIGTLSPGTYSATVSVASGGASNAPQNLSITLTLANPPVMQLSSSTLTFTGTAGGTNPVSKTVTVANSGGGTLAAPVPSVSYGTGAGWLSAAISGAGAPYSVTVTVDTSSLATIGTYTASVSLASKGAANSPQGITITLTLGSPPSIQLSSNTLSFAGTASGTNPPPLAITVTNAGGGSLAVPVVAVSYEAGVGWLTVSVGGAGAPYALQVQPTTGGLSVGVYSATVSVACAGATNTPQTVRVTLTLSNPPLMQLSTTSLSFSGTAGGTNPTAQTITVSNSGGGTLAAPVPSVIYAAGAGWLVVNASGTGAPFVLQVQPSIGGLAPGTYSATVSVACAGATNSPQTFAVTLILGSPPTLQLSSTALTFTQTTTSPPGPQTVVVSNVGSGVLPTPTTSIAFYSGSGWLATTVSGAVAPYTIVAQPNIGGLSAGTYTATISVAAPGASNNPQVIAVTLTVTTPLYIVGGTVAGLKGVGLVLATPGEANLVVPSGAEAFEFPDPLPNGSGYSVTVTQQPTSPTENCSVANGSGSISNANVTNVAITCVPLWSQVAAGGLHTAAIRTDGTLWVWGDNSAGQLGNNTTELHTSPIQVGADDQWQQVAAGANHTVALKKNGTIWAWGQNVFGQVGNGTTINRYSPTQIGTAADWVWVGAGGFQTLALKSNGDLWEWGALGGNVPTKILAGVTSADAGGGFGHCLAVTTDGTLWAWGSNYFGQLGLSVNATNSPMRVGTDADWALVAAGGDMSAAVKVDHSLWTWGYNYAGNLGQGTTAGNTYVPAPVKGGISQIAISHHSLAIATDGALWAWGNNSSGQVGDGSTNAHSTPIQVGTEKTWAIVSTGSSHSLALKTDGTLWAWGDNSSGQLGNGTTVQQTSPIPVRD